jgi:hypothetical protein
MAVPRVKSEGAEVPLARKRFSKWYLFAENRSSGMERPDLPRVPDADLYLFNFESWRRYPQDERISIRLTLSFRNSASTEPSAAAANEVNMPKRLIENDFGITGRIDPGKRTRV